MTAAAPDGSIAQRPSPRIDLLAFEIRAKISKPDIEWMSGIVDRAFETHSEVDMLLIMMNYEGSELGAIFSGEASAVQIRSLGRIRKYGVVGAPGWARAAIELSGKVTPVEAKTFDLAELREAWAWMETKIEMHPTSPLVSSAATAAGGGCSTPTTLARRKGEPR